MQPSGGIDNQYLESVFYRVFRSCLCNIDRLVFIAHGKNFHALLFPVNLQLFNRCRTIYVTGRQKRFFPFLPELSGNLCCRRRLSGTLQASHHNDSQLRAWLISQLGCFRAHQAYHFVIDDFNNHLAWI